MKYDVFISYRRKEGNGLEIARLIDSQIDQSIWYRSFLDFNELKDKEWGPEIFKAIDSAPVFLFVLTEGSLNRCVDEKDIVRQEILYAINNKKHIIPVNPEGKVKWNDIPKYIREKIPEEIRAALFDMQHSEISLTQLFKPSIRKLINERIRPHVPRVILLRKLVYSLVISVALLFLFSAGVLVKNKRAFNRDHKSYIENIKIAKDYIKKDPYSEEAVELLHKADSIAKIYQSTFLYNRYFNDDFASLVDKQFELHKELTIEYLKNSNPDAEKYLILALKLKQDEYLKDLAERLLQTK